MNDLSDRIKIENKYNTRYNSQKTKLNYSCRLKWNFKFNLDYVGHLSSVTRGQNKCHAYFLFTAVV